MKRCIATIITMLFLVSFSSIAYADCYDNYYSIHGAIVYAERWAYGFNPEYKQISDENGGDCTNFVSQCISNGGGIPEDSEFRRDANRLTSYTFINTPKLYSYLTSKGYATDAVYASNPINFTVNPGDLVIYDWDGDRSADHAAIVVGKYDNTPMIAEHSTPMYWSDYLAPVGDRDRSLVAIYFIHMTNAQGKTDVTNQFIGREVSLYSKKAGWTISVDSRDRFTVTNNEYGEAGFRASDGCYLSVNVSENDTSSPAFVREREQQYWESFRIFTNGNSYFIQSMANGKWMQVDDSGVFRAAGRAGSTWEELDIR